MNSSTVLITVQIMIQEYNRGETIVCPERKSMKKLYTAFHSLSVVESKRKEKGTSNQIEINVLNVASSLIS